MTDNKFEVDQLKKAFGSFATGVCVATSHTSGFTVNSFASLSLNPPLMIFNIYKTETDHVEFLKKDKFYPSRFGDLFIICISLITFSHFIHSSLLMSAAFSAALNIATVSASSPY